VVQDLFPWPLWQRATIRLPGASAVEREGSYVNAAGLLQTFSWSIRPPTGVQTEGRLLWRLTGGDGLLDSGLVRRKLAAELPRFAAAAELAAGQRIPLVDEPQSTNQLV
jgi:NADH-quinone oxidoreductase subunit G